MDANKPELATTRIGADMFADRFQILEELGRSEMSVVFKARELRLDRLVALKLLKTTFLKDSAHVQRFINEARACSTLSHPNIVQLLSFGLENEQPFMVLEYLEGKTLQDELSSQEKIDRDRFAERFLPIMDALAYAHSKGLVHRDLKPSNFMIIEDSSAIQVKILDFGIATILTSDDDKSDAQKTLALLGTPYYMSPEQCAGTKTDQRSDIYSLACVMYESIVGKPPFLGSSPFETMYEHLRQSVPRLVEISGSLGIPRELFETIIDALSKSPDKRPQTMLEFKNRIEQALGKPGCMQRKKAPANLLQALYAGLVILVILSLSLYLFHSGSNDNLVVAKRRSENPPGMAKDMILLKQAEKLLKDGKTNLALLKCQEAERTAKESRNDHPVWLFQVYMLRAQIEDSLKHPDKVRIAYEQAMDVFPDPTSSKRLEAMAQYCKWMQANGMNEDALSLYKSSFQAGERYLAGDADKHMADAYAAASHMVYFYSQKDCYDFARKSLFHFDCLPNSRNNLNAVNAAFLVDEIDKKQNRNKANREAAKTLKLLKETPLVQPEVCLYYAEKADSHGDYRAALEMYRLCLKNRSRIHRSRYTQMTKECQDRIKELEKPNAI